MPTSETPDGQCLCGKIRIHLSAKPDFSVMCYCQDCQRISGGGQLPQAAFNRAGLDVQGTVKTYTWASDAGNDLTLGFCGDCGSPIYKATAKMPDVLFLAVGLLDDPSVFASPVIAYPDCRTHISG